MLQIIIEKTESYFVAEAAQMAIEGGCGWLVLRPRGFSRDELRSLADDLVPLCKETGTILTIVDNATLARELGVHGVLINKDSSAAQIREELGPEAIVGAYTESAQGALMLEKSDVDYVALPASMPLDKATGIISDTRSAEGSIRFVSIGEPAIIDAERISRLLEAGFSGICVDGLFETSDPVMATERLINLLSGE